VDARLVPLCAHRHQPRHPCQPNHVVRRGPSLPQHWRGEACRSHGNAVGLSLWHKVDSELQWIGCVRTCRQGRCHGMRNADSAQCSQVPPRATELWGQNGLGNSSKRGATHPHRSRFTKPNQFPDGFKQNISQSVMHFNFNQSCQQCAQQTWFEIQQQNNTNIMNWLTLSFAIWATFMGNWTIPPSHTCVMQSNWADQHHDDKSISCQLNSVCASVNVSIPSTTPHKKCSSTFGLVVFFGRNVVTFMCL